MRIQKKIENYWKDRASDYSEAIWKEMESFKKNAWINLIDQYRPAGKPLKVLDIGTGPGFFAMLLSLMGHQVTAIDCTENMIREAKHNTERVDVQVDFHVMDSHNLEFADETFDLILCRNLVWTLRAPMDAYREWHRVLKPKGRLLVFDGNWGLRLHDPEMQRQYEEDKKRAKELGIIDTHDKANMAESDAITKELFLSKVRRPQWDAAALVDCGYDKVFIETDISERVRSEEDKILYRSTPMFMVGAEKK
ncbi:class I SAM-dependent methyltransferase [Geosporobacter ferrireducens]|uniref:Methyltransferase type 11 n=1 Tax=Geosporobacter ferrireducens TaxID=1424294 RepID=A0A1D8GL48_9FIRM|nr:class I SAM-dependent methyltransferase [Geosporobacter ferrireducens]AOT71628.1 methyltransferase type 11 [Geosporobacter ferrireducens]